jgi:hypothetical protein
LSAIYPARVRLLAAWAVFLALGLETAHALAMQKILIANHCGQPGMAGQLHPLDG